MRNSVDAWNMADTAEKGGVNLERIVCLFVSLFILSGGGGCYLIDYFFYIIVRKGCHL